MTRPQFPDGFVLQPLSKGHDREAFSSANDLVDQWLRTNARQCHDNHLSKTTALLASDGTMAGYYTLSSAHFDPGVLPMPQARLPKTGLLPVAVLAWLAVAKQHQQRGIGKLLLASALHDIAAAGRLLGVVAAVVDALDDSASQFYRRFGFETARQDSPVLAERLFLPFGKLAAMLRFEKRP